MKYIFFIAFSLLSIISNAQSKQTRIVLSNSYSLETATFETKDSSTLASLFSRTVSYENLDGKVESKEEAIQNIIHNKSIYTKSIEPFPYDFSMHGDSAVVKKRFKATEKKADGAEVALDLSITTIWLKDGRDWKLVRRKAVKN